jgi:2'-hydroxybiphenyl-2-sulfinate desulfinase
MSLAGFENVLALATLSLDDVEVVELPTEPVVPPGRVREERGTPRHRQLDELLDGRVDAIYVKGAASLEEAVARGAVVGIDLDSLPERRWRVNNGTPRPITVHEQLLETRPELVVDFLAESLRAAEWAGSHLDELREVLARETGSGTAGVLLAYRDGFHRSLHPTLDPDRVELVRDQKDFLLRHGFLAHDVDIDAWIDPEPLRLAHEQLGLGAS